MMKKIGKYIIKGLLGKGGMGRVYKVMTPHIEKISALKLLQPDPVLTKLLGKEAITKLFMEEAAVMASIRHPHIVDIRDFDTVDGNTFYLMEYYCNNLGIMMGESYILENPSRKIPVHKAFHYIMQILSGLERLHFSLMIHRDIKPYNILITDDDQVKICDFGLLKYRGEPFKGPSNLNVGSPYYAAPEQEKDPDSADFSADLYAVGVIFYRMITGELPMDTSDKKKWVKPSSIMLDLPSAFDDFIAKATHSNVNLRFQTTRSMQQSLRSLLKIWEENKEKTCSHYLFDTGNKTTPAFWAPKEKKHPTPLRSMPLKVKCSEAKTVFGLTKLSRPKRYTQNRLNPIFKSAIRDEATGLIWQQSGSAYPLDWKGANAYIKQLNKDRCDGFRHWRLPTIEELITLLSDTTRKEAGCIDSLFDPSQKWIWSADRQSFISAWFVNIELGFVWHQDFSAFYYVKAVCAGDVHPHSKKVN